MKRLILDAKEIRRIIRRIAVEILENNQGTENLALIGIQKGGVALSKRLAEEIGRLAEVETEIPLGCLDITLFRDDLERREDTPVPRETEIEFDLDDRVVILVDDVLYTGRSIRAAMDALSDFGRPRIIRLAVLIDRGRREYPIQPDFAGRRVPTGRDEKVIVHLKESDGEDAVYLAKEK